MANAWQSLCYQTTPWLGRLWIWAFENKKWSTPLPANSSVHMVLLFVPEILCTVFRFFCNFRHPKVLRLSAKIYLCCMSQILLKHLGKLGPFKALNCGRLQQVISSHHAKNVSILPVEEWMTRLAWEFESITCQNMLENRANHSLSMWQDPCCVELNLWQPGSKSNDKVNNIGPPLCTTNI